MSPDGSRVFVTGQSLVDAQGDREYATVAYAASTGAQLWARVHAAHTPTGGVAVAEARAIVVSPDGKVVYVTGYSGQARGGAYDYLTIAYDAATGQKLWVARYNGTGNGNDSATAIAASPDGKSVYATGGSRSKTSGMDFATTKYSAATGRQLWGR